MRKSKEITTKSHTTGTRFHQYGNTAEIAAYPYEGYAFLGWSNGVSDSLYTFEVTGNIVLMARFGSPDEVGIESAIRWRSSTCRADR